MNIYYPKYIILVLQLIFINPIFSTDSLTRTSDFGSNIFSAGSGLWNSTSTWQGGVVPSSIDNVFIGPGHTITVNIANVEVNDLTITSTGRLSMENTASIKLTINRNLLNDGTLSMFNGTTGRTLALKLNLTNNGVIDMTKTNSLLELTGTSPQTINGVGTFTDNAIFSLKFNNSSTTYPSVQWSLNNINVTNSINFTSGRIAINGNYLVAGTEISAGSITYVNGGIVSGTFGLGFAPSTVGTIISANSDPGTASYGLFPFINTDGTSRFAFVQRNFPTGSGILGMTFNNVSGSSSVNVNDATTPSYLITSRMNESWTPVNLAGTLTATSFELALNAPNLYGISSFTYPRVMQTNSVVGNNQAGTITPTAQRSGLTLANLLSGAFYIGINANDIPSYTLESGNWGNPLIWSKGVVPLCDYGAVIKSGNIVTISNGVQQSRYLTIQPTAALTISSGEITIGCTNNNNTLNNQGELNILGGTVKVNGNVINSINSIFYQSNGDFTIDGNSGTGISSVIAGTPLLQFNQANSGVILTGGTLTITDPHIATTATSVISFNSTILGTQTSTSDHLLRIGDGISTQSGGGSSGFRIENWVSSGFLSFGSIEINSGIGTNRNVTFPKSIALNGNLTVKANSTVSFSSTLILAGNLNIESSAIVTATTVIAAVVSSNSSSTLSYTPTTLPQIFTNNGVLRNTTTNPTANLNTLEVNNNNSLGFTCNSPLSINTTLNLISGKLNTTSTNLLTARKNCLINGGDSNSYINGPMIREFQNFSASSSFNNSTFCPVGKNDKYQPLWISPNIGSTLTGFKVESFLNNSGSTNPGTSLNTNSRWEVIPNNIIGFAYIYLKFGESEIQSNQQILQSSSANGIYSNTTSQINFSMGSPNTLITIDRIFVNDFMPYFGFGQLPVCQSPIDQPTSLQVTHTSPTAFNANFSHPDSGPGRYLIVRYSDPNAPLIHPTNGVNYQAGSSLGSGIVVVQSGSSNMFTQSSLSPSTSYKYVIYSFNGINCSNNNFNINDPLISIITTCFFVYPPSGLKMTSRTQTSFGFKFNKSTTQNAEHRLDVATDSNFNNILPSYNDYIIPVGVSNIIVSGLNPSTKYFFRIRGFKNGCPSTFISGSRFTDCPPITPPYNMDFSNDFDCLEIINENASNTWTLNTNTAISNGNCALYIGNIPFKANDYLITKGLILTAGKTYLLSYTFKNWNFDIQKMDVRFGTDRTISGLQSLLADYPTIVNSDTTLIRFIPTVSDTFYFAFRAYSDPSNIYLFLDDISITETQLCTTVNSGDVKPLFSPICGINKAPLSSTGFSVGSGTNYQWQRSIDNFTNDISDIPGATNPDFFEATLFPAGNYFRLKTTCDYSSSESISNVVTTTYSNPQITSTNAVTRCGKGTVNLSATASPPYNIRWYDQIESLPSTNIGIGSNITSPVINNTTTFYASKVDTIINYTKTIGRGTRYVQWVAESPYYYGYGAQKTQYIYTAKELVDMGYNRGFITSVGIDITNLNNYTLNGFYIGLGTTLQEQHIPNQMISGISTVYYNSAQSHVSGLNTYNFTTPYYWDGISNLVIQFSFSNNDTGIGGLFTGLRGDIIPYKNLTMALLADNVTPLQMLSALSTTSFPTTAYYGITSVRPKIILKGTGACEGSRTPLIATVVPSPPLSLSRDISPICPSSTSNLLTLTSNIGDYDTYTWTPSTNVSGNQTSGYQFNPGSSTVYTLNAIQSAGLQCNNSITHTVVRNTNPTAIVVTPSSNNVCANTIPLQINTSGGIINPNVITPSSSLYLTDLNVFKTQNGGNKTQSIYLASELNALGLQNGSEIFKIAYQTYPVYPNSNAACTDLTIRMKHTKLNQIFALETGLTDVHGPLTFPPPTVNGWVDFTFHTNFVWNGIDNIIVEVVHNSSISGHTYSTNHVGVNTSTQRTYLVSEDNVDGGIPGFDAVEDYDYVYFGNYVPLLKIFHRVPTNKTWSPLTGLYLDSLGLQPYNNVTTPNANSIFAKPPSTTSYIVTATATSGCTSSSMTTINVEGTIVKNANNAGFNSLRNVVNCAEENAIITFDQPAVSGSVLTTPLTISKHLTFLGLNSTLRPLITLPSNGLSIYSNKTLTLENIDIKTPINISQTLNTGDLNIKGTTVIKN